MLICTSINILRKSRDVGSNLKRVSLKHFMLKIWSSKKIQLIYKIYPKCFAWPLMNSFVGRMKLSMTNYLVVTGQLEQDLTGNLEFKLVLYPYSEVQNPWIRNTFFLLFWFNRWIFFDNFAWLQNYFCFIEQVMLRSNNSKYYHA